MAGIRHRRFEEFEYQSWNPLSEKKTEAKEWLRVEFEAHLKAELDEYSEEIGYKPKPSPKHTEPRKGTTRPGRGLVVRTSSIGSAENVACFAYPHAR